MLNIDPLLAKTIQKNKFIFFNGVDDFEHSWVKSSPKRHAHGGASCIFLKIVVQILYVYK